MDEYRKYEPIFRSWYLKRLIGKGSFGKVYEITRDEFGETYKAALKIITVPTDDEEIRTLMSEGMDPEMISDYYEDVLRGIVNENMIMSRLKGHSNIVSYEDHQIIPHDDGIGYDILIRMELLTPLVDRIAARALGESDVVRLGIDMCKALEVCHKNNIIHRDIKPQNIFVSDTGDFKLGDFGIARNMEKTAGIMSRKGTYNYMAPEVFRGGDYDSTADIYSLGVVMYTLLNGNRGPFMPEPSMKLTPRAEEEARLRRFRGEPVPVIQSVSPILGGIIQKACSADPKNRYRTASGMRRDLEDYLWNYGVKNNKNEDRTEAVEYLMPKSVLRKPSHKKENEVRNIRTVDHGISDTADSGQDDEEAPINTYMTFLIVIAGAFLLICAAVIVILQVAPDSSIAFTIDSIISRLTGGYGCIDHTRYFNGRIYLL